MLKTAIIAAALLSAASLPASSASMAMSKCDEASMMSAQGKIDAMTDGSQKKMAMKEMTMAQSSMKSHNMKSCGMHMDKAMKAMGTM
ncbi:hypothetical protein [Rhizobium tubonense]|uniref:hypothetical protein n=1 Tax=Rhizobium tubonense TaxID=484088 RepID=UPI001FCEFE5C|nr:hypothetical protein [Rhizobium tubonense]